MEPETTPSETRKLSLNVWLTKSLTVIRKTPKLHMLSKRGKKSRKSPKVTVDYQWISIPKYYSVTFKQKINQSIYYLQTTLIISFFTQDDLTMTPWDTFFAFFNGMCAGWSQVFVMQPFEIIKVRLQTQPRDAKIYNGILDCGKQIFLKQGPLAFYKGTLTPLMGQGILGSVRFGVFENTKKRIAQAKGISISHLNWTEKAFSALVGGIVTSFFLCPIEHTRIRIQIQKSQAEKVYSGSFDAMVKIAKQHGVRGMFRGQAPSTIREGTGLMLYFTTIQGITNFLAPAGVAKKDLPMYIPFIAGGIGGTSYWVFNYPFDYVKTLMQTDKLGDYKYPSMASVFKDQYQKYGISTFYKGYVICMMRSFPVNAAGLMTYRVMQKISNVTQH